MPVMDERRAVPPTAASTAGVQRSKRSAAAKPKNAKTKKKLRTTRSATVGGDTIEVGGRVWAKFSNGAYYWGEVTKIFLNKRSGDFVFDVLFDDGDARAAIPDWELVSEECYMNDSDDDKEAEVKPEPATSATSQSDDEEDKDDDEKDVKPEPSTSAISLWNPVVTLEDDVKCEEGDEEDVKPEPSTYASEATANTEPAHVPSTIQVKAELCQARPDFAYSTANVARQARRDMRMSRNLTKDGTPRKVFRRGCHVRCLTQILGGSGTNPGPIVKHPPMIHGLAANPFIKAGELYFAGNAEWNPWTPFFSGDKGFLGTYVANKLKRNGQEAFHMFLRCAKKPHEPYYHGPNAKEKCLYLGRYRVVPDAEDGICSVIYTFSSLTPESQFAMAEYDSRSRDYGTDIGPGYYEGAETVANADAPGQWGTFGERKQQVLAWVEKYIAEGKLIEVVPVEFVDYDEKLYEALVEFGAANGEVATDELQLGPM